MMPQSPSSSSLYQSHHLKFDDYGSVGDKIADALFTLTETPSWQELALKILPYDKKNNCFRLVGNITIQTTSKISDLLRQSILDWSLVPREIIKQESSTLGDELGLTTVYQDFPSTKEPMAAASAATASSQEEISIRTGRLGQWALRMTGVCVGKSIEAYIDDSSTCYPYQGCKKGVNHLNMDIGVAGIEAVNLGNSLFHSVAAINKEFQYAFQLTPFDSSSLSTTLLNSAKASKETVKLISTGKFEVPALPNVYKFKPQPLDGKTNCVYQLVRRDYSEEKCFDLKHLTSIRKASDDRNLLAVFLLQERYMKELSTRKSSLHQHFSLHSLIEKGDGESLHRWKHLISYVDVLNSFEMSPDFVTKGSHLIKLPLSDFIDDHVLGIINKGDDIVLNVQGKDKRLCSIIGKFLGFTSPPPTKNPYEICIETQEGKKNSIRLDYIESIDLWI